MHPVSALRMISPELYAAQSKLAAPPIPPAMGAGGAMPLRELERAQPNLDLRAVEQARSGGSFESVLQDFVREVQGKQTAAADAVNAVLSGQNVSLHQAMIAMEEAGVSFQLMVEVRNKLLESYQELMRMQI